MDCKFITEEQIVEVQGHCGQCGCTLKIEVAKWYAEGVLKDNPEAWCPNCFPAMFEAPVICKWQLVQPSPRK